MKSDTIAAISTAQGEGGIGVIRVSGKNSIEICDRIFKAVSGRKLSDMKGYTAALGHVYKDDEKLDEVIATVFREPHSYTGENIVELSCHGGIFITREILRTVIEAGAEPALAGEFTKRAFLNGKLDLTEAEAVIDIISAKSKNAARAAILAKEGALWRRIENIKNKLVTTAAHFSAWADYPEEDIEEVSVESLSNTFNECLFDLNKLLSTYDMGQTVKEGIDTVIAGKPNTGKSTLMNLISGRNRSIVTDIPGTTRDIIEETVSVGGVILRLCDTAGMRDTEDKVEKIGVDIAKSRIKNCGLVLAVFDAGRELDEDDKKLIENVKDAPVIAVINKTDLEKKLDEKYIGDRIEKIVKISAKNGEGFDELCQLIEKIAGTADFNPSEGILANERQRKAALNAKKSLEEATQALNAGMTFDAVTVSIEEAIENILELTGERVSDVVVDNVFHNFCVGK
ncbi:MAG: tRNA uridine-5-carboxymethylaminomethyl(34) synthesis GTPase MnmE [Ruminococcus sp.]|nr:tRNA uridine-5-carboxymethylaminomethyl(34) synthesis GTPase MnmE [Ruminococcus sp.]